MSKEKFITPEELRSIRLKLPDAYDGDTLTDGQLNQLIEQTAPYTDFLLVKGHLKTETMNALEEAGLFVDHVYGIDTHPERQKHTYICWAK